MPDATEAVERERKFEAPDLIKIPDVPGTSVLERSHVKLTATYWDTVSRRLLRWGHTLRYRRASDGSEQRWTLKLALPARKQAELQRAEVHATGRAQYPPSLLRRYARAFVRRAVLMPIAMIVTDRRRVELVGTDPTERIEISDDHVSSIVGMHRGPTFRQIEVEAGSPGAEWLMDDVSNALIEAGAVPTDASKLETVLGETPEPEIVVPGSGAGMSITDAIRFAVGSSASRLIANDPAARIGSDPEAIHQARVATRRLRADLKTLGSLLHPTAVERIRSELRWVGELLGSVRDTDVLISRMQQEARRLRVKPEATSAIVTELEHDRARSHEALVDALASERYVALVQTLVGVADSPPLAEGLDGDGRAGPTVRKLVRRSWRHLARAVEQLGSDPADAALHEIRKRAKRARYAVELAVSALDADADVLADKLADLQDVLGDLQDAVVAEERLATLVRDGRLASGAAFAAGELACTMGHARADARDRWLAAWKTARRKELRRELR